LLLLLLLLLLLGASGSGCCRRSGIVAAQHGRGAGGRGSGHSGQRHARRHTRRIHAVRGGQGGLLQGGGGGRLAVIDVDRRGRGAVGRLGGSGGRVRPGAQIGRGTAVQPLEGGIVARLGEQFQSHRRLTLPFGSEIIKTEIILKFTGE